MQETKAASQAASMFFLIFSFRSIKLNYQRSENPDFALYAQNRHQMGFSN
jgi:hypothetical protein